MNTIAKRSGWVTLAATVALVVGGYQVLSGIGAITEDDTLATDVTQVLFGINITAWGWFWLILGTLQLLAGVLILQRNEWGLALGATLAGMSAFVTVFVIFVFPLWSIAVLTLDALVLYGLLAHGDEFE